MTKNTNTDDTWSLGGRRWHSRLILGTGKYRSFQENLQALEASGAEMVTVAIRRVNLDSKTAKKSGITTIIDPKRYLYLPNTAGCYTAQEALRTLRLAREAGGWTLVKLEVIGDEKTLYPNMRETFLAAEALIKEGFDVMAYTMDDPVATVELEAMGCVAVMPLAAPIGSGLGIQNALNISLIVERAKIPVLVDAGVGCASDACRAMELGCDAVLLNTSVASASDSLVMARAMRLGVEAGRLSYLAGRIEKRLYGKASSPKTGMIANQ